MPHTTDGQIRYLIKLLGLPPSTFNARAGYQKLSNEVVLEALTGVVLYHHLDRLQKMQVMRFLHDNLHGPALAACIGKITDPMVNPHWGLWAKSTQELKADLEFAETVSTYLGLAGASFSIPALYNISRKDSANKRGARSGHPLFVVLIWGFYYNHESGRKSIQSELLRRTQSH